MFNIFSMYLNLKKEIYIICLAQLINKLGTFVIPFLTMYLTQKKGFNAQEVGVTMTAILCCSFLGSIIGGKAADKFGRRKVYILFQSLAGIFLIPCSVVGNTSIIILLLGLSSLSYSAVVPTLSTLVADIVDVESRQAGYSLLYMCSNLGTIIGPLLGMILYNSYTNLLFLGDGLSCLLAVILVAIFVNNNDDINDEYKSIDFKEKETLLTILIKRPYFIYFFITFIIITMVYSQQSFALPLTLDNIFIERGADIYASLISFSAITVCFITAPITYLSKKFNPLVNISVSAILFAIGFGVIGIIKTLPLFLISTFIWTCAEILLMNNLNVFIANNSPKNYMARLSSLISVSWSLGSMMGTSFIGKIFNDFGIISTWRIVCLLSMITSCSSILIYIYIKKSNKLKEVI
ncbi:MFS transporter [Clostridium sp.]|uniref:MFS transporter n=1 Tax=Clostridium sp. TaxID=1506 RepID=UPI003F36CA9B